MNAKIIRKLADGRKTIPDSKMYGVNAEIIAKFRSDGFVPIEARALRAGDRVATVKELLGYSFGEPEVHEVRSVDYDESWGNVVVEFFPFFTPSCACDELTPVWVRVES